MKLPHLLLLLVLALFGVASFLRMPRDVDPPLPDRTAQVVSLVPGVAPADIEKRITIPVERALADLPGIESIGSESSLGTSVVALTIESGIDPQPVLTAARERIERLRSRLGPAVPFLSGPWLESTETIGLFDTLLVVTAPEDPDKTNVDLLSRAHELADSLRAEETVTQCAVLGEPASAVYVRYEDEDLEDAGLTPQLLAERLRASLTALPGGYVGDPKSGTFLPVVFDQSPDRLQALRDLPVRDPRDGSVTPLDELCKIEQTPIQPALGGIRIGGHQALALAIKRRPDASPDDYTAAIDRIAGRADDLTLTRALDRPAETQRLTASTGRLVLISVALVLALVVVTMGPRIGLATALAILVSLGVSFLVLHGLGFEWNLVTLAAVSVAVGLLVDNHIVVGHHARRLAAEGETDLCTRCLRELAGPLTISMLTTVIAFVPAWLLRDGPGEYVSSLAPVVAVCLVVSLAVGFLLTPELAAKTGMAARPVHSGAYLRLIEWLRPRSVLVLIGLGLSAGLALLLSGMLTTGALPSVDSDRQSVVRLSFPVGTSHDVVASASSDLAERLATAGGNPAIEFLGTDPPAVFRGMNPRLPRPSQATLLLDSPTSAELARGRDKELAEFAKEFPAASIDHSALSLSPRLPHPVALRLTAPDRATLTDATSAALESLDAFKAKTDEQIESFVLSPDFETLAEEGFLPLDLASAAATATTGLPVASLEVDAHRTLPVLLAQQTDARPEVAVEEAYVHRTKGRPTFLEDLAEVSRQPVAARLARWNGRPAALLTAKTESDLDLASIELPDGSALESIGTAAKAKEPVTRVIRYLPVTAVAILLLLVFQTGSGAATAAVCLNALPALAGALLALVVCGQPFGIMALLGTITVGGILVNNAVLLVDRLRKEQAFTDREVAEVSAHRFRPIVVTALCAILGVIPLAVAGSALWTPFAVALIGGILGATVSTVLWIPVSWMGKK